MLMAGSPAAAKYRLMKVMMTMSTDGEEHGIASESDPGKEFWPK